MKILITGGAGYIGSHALLEALKNDHEVLVYDNFSNASPEALRRVTRLANHQFETVAGDIRDGDNLHQTYQNFAPDLTIHFAGLKAVGESVEKPLDYYAQNVFGSIQVLRAMEASGCRNMVFSSTATVYGAPQYLPFDESHPLNPESPYGRSKLMVEQVISDWTNTNPENTGIVLRYFNPVGAHDSGDIGEDPLGLPNNLMPFVQQVAIGRRNKLSIFGDDYDTEDGTGVRDYIHVSDLAEAHLKAAEFAARNSGFHAFNLGSGTGHSVLEVVHAFEEGSGKKIPYEIAPRRAGDIASSIANPEKANRELGWKTKMRLEDMCASAWNFQSRNPEGYGE